jgi:surface protein
MDSTIKNDKTKVSLNEKFITNIGKVKSKYILKRIFNHIFNKKLLEIIRYNKKMQNRLDISIKTYIKLAFYFSSIEIEIIPSKTKFGKFINITEFEKIFYHIYFNDNKDEIKYKYRIKEEDKVTKHEYYIEEEDKVTKIKIIIEYQVKSFKELFRGCECIKSINFKKFYRNNNITDMSSLFSFCSSLKELNLNNFNTNKVTNMRSMFS